jgi:uncharacterized DUF497 family protein
MFEWDERKRLSNLAKHGFDFLDVPSMFDGPVLRRPARSIGGEARFYVFGLIAGRVAAVILTRRGAGLRIISARRARSHEEAEFWDHAGNG